MTIVIEFFFFIVMCLNFSINVQQVVLLFQKAIRPILCALARPPFKGARGIGWPQAWGVLVSTKSH